MEIFFLLIVLSFIPAFIANKKGRNFGAWYAYAFLIFPIAFFHSLFLNENEKTPGRKKCPYCASIIPEEAGICPACKKQQSSQDKYFSARNEMAESFFTQKMDLGSIEYQDYLVKKYDVTKNEILNKFIVGDQGFDNLSDVLQSLHNLEKAKLDNPSQILQKGKIGPGEIFDFVRYPNRVVVTHASGYTREFPTIEEAERSLNS